MAIEQPKSQTPTTPREGADAVHPGYKFEVKSSAAITNWAFLFVAFIFLMLLLNRALSSGKSFLRWDVGDWLINFEAGLIRRGLFGEILSILAKLGINPETVLITFVMTLYATLFLATFILFVCRNRTWPWFMIFASPAFLAFPFWLSLAPFTGAYKKEVILFAICSLISLRAVFKISRIGTYIPIVVLFILGCFSHEIVPLSLPLLSVMLFLYTRWKLLSRQESLWLFVFFCVFSAAGIVFALIFSGDSTTAFQICRRLIEMNYSIDTCGGAVRSLWIEMNVFTQIYDMFLPQYIGVYGLITGFVLLPALLIRGNKDLLIVGILYLACLLPLYPIGIDWGRWISISTTFFYMTVLVRSYIKPLEFRAVPSWIVFLMVFFWSPPLICVHDCHIQMQTFTRFSLPDPYTMEDYEEWLENRYLAP